MLFGVNSALKVLVFSLPEAIKRKSTLETKALRRAKWQMSLLDFHFIVLGSKSTYPFCVLLTALYTCTGNVSQNTVMLK